jgi:hypothetical protein
VRGEKGNWYRRLQANAMAGIIVGDERVTVHAVRVGADETALVSELFRRKYPADQHLFAILRPEVTLATLRLEPDAAPQAIDGSSSSAVTGPRRRH